MGHKLEVINLKHEKKTDRQERIEGWHQEVLDEAKALVVGAGAIGNELLKNLALVGFGYVLVCDMDRIEESNLSRTVLFNESNLGEMKSEVAVRKYLEMNTADKARADVFVGNVCTELGTGVFNQVDLVIGCLDNLQARYEMNRRCSLVGKPFIDAGIANLTANLTVVHSSETEPCWACMYSSKKAEETKSMVRSSCGIGAAAVRKSGKAPTTQPPSALVAGFQSNEVIKCLHAMKKESMPFDAGRHYIFNGWYNSFDRFKLVRKEECADHRRYDRIDQTPISCDWTLRRTLEYVRENYGEGYFLNIENDNQYHVAGFVTTAKCRHCGKTIEVNRSMKELKEDELYCEQCPHVPTNASEGEKLFYFYEGPEQEAIMDFTLSRLGIPPLHILEFEPEDETRPVLALEMTADLEKVMPNLVKKA